MKPAIQFLLTLVVLSAGIGCTDNDEPNSMYDSKRILACHDEQAASLEETKSKLVGLWEWKQAEYVYAIPPDKDLVGMRIELRGDDTGTLMYKGESPLEFTWSIGTYDIYFSFSTDPLIPHLSGHILLCDDVMLCGIAGSELADGVNNYYQKIQ